MLINLRNALMAGKRLPYDAEVEYLQSSGTQWIDTLVNADSNLSVEITMANAGTPWTNTNPTGTILATPRCRHHLNFNNGGTNNGINYFLGNGDNCFVSSGRRTANGEIFTFKVDATSKTFALDSFIGTFPNDTFNTGLSYWLFGRNGTTPPYLGSLRIFSAKLWNGNTLVRDFIPVRKGTVGYLYDRVSGKLFGNEGTGDFVLGPDVVPVEYIESHGTEWIDTGVYATLSTVAQIRFLNIVSTGDVIFGAYESDDYSDYRLFNASEHMIFDAYNKRLSKSAGLKSNVWRELEFGNFYVKDLETGTEIARGVTGTGNLPSTTLKLNHYVNRSTQTNSQNRWAYVKIYDGNTPVRNYTSVRVGTEGAMMDVLTRRIYRNAGTGAFTYGNDLKYPIPAS